MFLEVSFVVPCNSLENGVTISGTNCHCSAFRIILKPYFRLNAMFPFAAKATVYAKKDYQLEPETPSRLTYKLKAHVHSQVKAAIQFLRWAQRCSLLQEQKQTKGFGGYLADQLCRRCPVDESAVMILPLPSKLTVDLQTLRPWRPLREIKKRLPDFAQGYAGKATTGHPNLPAIASRECLAQGCPGCP